MRVRPGGLGFPRLNVTLRYMKLGTLTSSTLAQVNQVLAPSNAFDVDPLFASTALAGFTEYGGLYRFYRVQSSRLRVNFSNVNATGAYTCYVGPANLNLGTGLTSAQAISFMSQPTTRFTQLGPSTGNSDKSISLRVSTARFAGAYVSGTVDPYCGPTSGATAPTNQWYFIYGVVGGIALTVGVEVTVQLECEIEFFEFSNPAT